MTKGSNSSSIGLIIGVAGGVLLCCAIAMVFFVILKKKKANNRQQIDANAEEDLRIPHDTQNGGDTVELRDVARYETVPDLHSADTGDYQQHQVRYQEFDDPQQHMYARAHANNGATFHSARDDYQQHHVRYSNWDADPSQNDGATFHSARNNYSTVTGNEHQNGGYQVGNVVAAGVEQSHGYGRTSNANQQANYPQNQVSNDGLYQFLD